MEKFLVSFGLILSLGFLSACSAASPAAGGEVTGPVWILTELNGNPPLSGSTITAEFTKIGRLAGSAGCNRYNGTYSTDGSSITFSESMSTTMMMCEQPLMDQESAYLKALGDAKTYAVDGDQLTLFGADQSKLAIFNAQKQGLAGTAWDVIAYNNGKQAVTSVMAGTSLTAEFGSDGSISGDSGCNTFGGSYTVSGNQITIGPLGGTEMACLEPQGVMDQESQYLAALQTAATYKVEGNRLQLRTADGALAVDLTAK